MIFRATLPIKFETSLVFEQAIFELKILGFLNLKRVLFQLPPTSLYIVAYPGKREREILERT